MNAALFPEKEGGIYYDKRVQRGVRTFYPSCSIYKAGNQQGIENALDIHIYEDVFIDFNRKTYKIERRYVIPTMIYIAWMD